MRNLRNIRFDVWGSPPEFAIRDISAVAWDSATGDVILTYGPSHGDDIVELVRAKKDFEGQNETNE